MHRYALSNMMAAVILKRLRPVAATIPGTAPDETDTASVSAGVSKNLLARLLLVSFATLYVEVMLIRWVGTEVRVFAYFQNLALIACFLGFGLGCHSSARKKSQISGLLALAALVALIKAPFASWQAFLANFSNLLAISPDALIWGIRLKLGSDARLWLSLLSVLILCLLLLLLVNVMVPLGQWVGYYLDAAPDPVTAYSVNLLGSVAGIWAFAGGSLLWLPPLYWFGFALLLYMFLQPPTKRVILLGLVLFAAALVLLREPASEWNQTYWSPYQKLSVTAFGQEQYGITTNNTGYLGIANTTPQFLARNPEIQSNLHDHSSYDAPFRFVEHRDRVLIVGAGAGNDAAAVLRNGAGQVDAVEIDPVIYAVGKRLHPDKPYLSPKVRMVINDARAFMRKTGERYDVILFGLLDSHTQFSDFSNMRIDNYVYTEEAFREAKRLLKRDGILIVKFHVDPFWEWIGRRFYVMLTRVFDRPPVTFHTPVLGIMPSATVFITSASPSFWSRVERSQLLRWTAENAPPFSLTLDDPPPLATDDWPYVYHRSRSIPRTYLVVSALLLLIALASVGRVFQPGLVTNWYFFFLGAGFLLLETHLISRLALYFGTTWLVNCIALTTILLMLVAANVYVARTKPEDLKTYYAGLLVCLLVNYLLPWHMLPFGARTVGVLLSLAYSFPLFFAGVVFTEVFRRTAGKSTAFGANIVGAVAGGLAQNLSFIIGLNALLLLGAVFYTLAAVFRRPAESRATG